VKTNTHFWSCLAYFFLKWEIFQTNIVEKIKTRILCWITFLENHAVYELMWKNVVEPGRRSSQYSSCICLLQFVLHVSSVLFLFWSVLTSSWNLNGKFLGLSDDTLSLCACCSVDRITCNAWRTVRQHSFIEYAHCCDWLLLCRAFAWYRSISWSFRIVIWLNEG
jgi:hypothetical protein